MQTNRLHVMSTLKPKPELTIDVPERQCWVDSDPREPYVYVKSPEPNIYCPLCKHWNDGPNAKSTISPKNYSPMASTYRNAPASPLDKEQIDKDLAEQLRRAAVITAALDREIARLQALVGSSE
jgi:hypothetical protein